MSGTFDELSGRWGGGRRVAARGRGTQEEKEEGEGGTEVVAAALMFLLLLRVVESPGRVVEAGRGRSFVSHTRGRL